MSETPVVENKNGENETTTNYGFIDGGFASTSYAEALLIEDDSKREQELNKIKENRERAFEIKKEQNTFGNIEVEGSEFEGKGNTTAYIDGRNNPNQNINSKYEWGDRSTRIDPKFDARSGEDDDSGIIGGWRDGKREYYTGFDKESGAVTVYRAGQARFDDPIGYYDIDGNFVPLQNKNGKDFATNNEKAYFTENNDTTIHNATLVAQKEWEDAKERGEVPPPPSPHELRNKGETKEEKEKQLLEDGVTADLDDTVNREMNARKKYRVDLEYPIGITDLLQDKLKITVLKFEPADFGGSKLVLSDVLDENRFGTGISWFGQKDFVTSRIEGEGSPFIQKRRPLSDREILGATVLPIPDGLIDSNSVQFAQGQLNPLQMALSNVALKALLGGEQQAGNTAADLFKTAMKDGTNMSTALSTSLVASATQSDGNLLLARTKGKIFNNNLQLLFSGPTLRPFQFQYDLTARDQKESDEIKRIIRMFKQSMAVQRDDIGIFLGSPNTYRLEFLDATLETHQYLPRIKECALLSFNVNYMPTNSYMTYGDSSMVVYRLNFQFQELDPIFNDDYGNMEGTDSADTEIGF